MENDPLELLIVPHEVIEWQRKRGLLLKRLLPEVARRQLEKGKFAVFHGELRLRKLFNTPEEAHAHIDELIGDKRKCWENKRIYSVKQL